VRWVAALVDLARRSDIDNRYRFAWILLVVLLPLAASIVYFVRRPVIDADREPMIAAEIRH
jgi:Phospholipase_D-nuclease N-terminal